MENTILRVNKNKNYTVVCNIHLKDIRLSWGAKGLLTYLLSLPDDWKIYLNELTNHTKDGVTKTSTLIKELTNTGYMKKERIRGKNGRYIRYEYIVSEIPFNEDENCQNASTNRNSNSGNNITNEHNNEGKNNYKNINCQNSSTSGNSNLGKTNLGKSSLGKTNTTKYLSNKELKKQSTNNNTEILNTTDNPDETNNIKNEIENTLHCEANIEVLKKTIKKNNLLLDDIRYYLANWHKFDYKTKDNPIAFLLHLVTIKAVIPKGKQGFTKPDQSYNFEQRKYDDDYFDSLYDNFRE